MSGKQHNLTLVPMTGRTLRCQTIEEFNAGYRFRVISSTSPLWKRGDIVEKHEIVAQYAYGDEYEVEFLTMSQASYDAEQRQARYVAPTFKGFEVGKNDLMALKAQLERSPSRKAFVEPGSEEHLLGFIAEPEATNDIQTILDGTEAPDQPKDYKIISMKEYRELVAKGWVFKQASALDVQRAEPGTEFMFIEKRFVRVASRGV